MKKLLVIVLVLLCFGCNQDATQFKTDDIIIDVRSENEYEKAHIKNAKSIPLEQLEDEIETITKDKTEKIYVYCQSGTRSALALTELKKLGYTNVENLGGISDKYELEGE